MIAISILGLASGSLGYYLAVNKPFFQDSKADAVPPLPPSLVEDIANTLRKLPVNKVDDIAAASARLQAARRIRQGLSAIRVIPKKFQAVPITDDLIAYRVPNRQALENPSIIGEPLTLRKDTFYDVVEVVEVDNRSWLKLNPSDPNQSIYIDPNRVLCTTPVFCFGEWKYVESDPLAYNYYASRVNEIPEQLQVGW
ncbi:hypothetical protein QUA45_03125 [Microcoleus sp. Pol12A5]